MEHLSWQRLAIIAGITLAIAWVITRMALGDGYTPALIPWTLPAICVVGAVLALVFAWPVRQYQQGKRPGLDGLRAARAAVFAQASAYAGVLLAGGLLGYAAGLAEYWSHEPRREVAISALIAALGALALMAAGLLAEHWCRTKPPEDPKPSPS
ncbi:DUF3180 family protein [Demequina sp.]|uniref:DUF3180 family protein n=1 Tax=Demequina sp. TaxID=2050685 RepID=UPI003D0D1F04